ncbi:MAG: hypothetical protein ACRD1Y_05980 [Terriglobales bacterium]
MLSPSAPRNTALSIPPPINWLNALAALPPPPPLPSQQQALPQAAQQQAKPKAKPPAPGHHLFWVIPAYQVEYLKNVPPLSPHEKFVEMAEDAYDPLGLALSGAEVLVLEHNRKTGFCEYGGGWGGFGKCYGAAWLDANISGALGDWALPVWWHQDPRYFRLGTGSVFSRTLYALSRVFICRSDSGKTVLDTSQLTGTVAASFISNLYYPKTERGTGLTMSRIGIDLGGTAIFNLEAEFWQDIHQKLFH